MKRVFTALLAAVLLMSMVSAFSVSAADVMYGDVNGDGKINNRDLGLLQQYLNEGDVTVDAVAADANGDGKTNNRDLGLLQQYLNEWDVTLGPTTEPDPDPDTPVTPPDVPDVPDVPTTLELPAIGYDLDGRGRIFVKDIYCEDNVVTVTLENISEKWMSEETSYVKYTCTDAEGNVLYLDNKYYGKLYFGMLEAKEVDTFTITLPEGTMKLEFGDCYAVYWTQWKPAA